MENLHPGLFTFFLSLVTFLVTIGVSWGVYKTQISNLIKKIDDLEISHGKFKQWVYDAFEGYDKEVELLEKELNKKINDDIKELNYKRDLQFKELEKAVRVVENRCAARAVYTESIPRLVAELQDVKIEVGSMPSKLSNELTKSFSEEYQKIIAVIVNKENNKK